MIKKIIYILILFIVCSNFTIGQAFSKPKKAQIQYDSDIYTPKSIDAKKLINKANANMLMWEMSLNEIEKKFYLDQAMRNYYMATKINGTIIDANTGLARVYDEMKLDRLAKEYFCKAINLNTYDPKANLYFANFYFSRNDFLNALIYYKIAYEHGFSQNYELNYRLGVIYEKIADIETAKAFYLKALCLKPSNTNLADKIRLLDDLNYSESQYYLFKKK